MARGGAGLYAKCCPAGASLASEPAAVLARQVGHVAADGGWHTCAATRRHAPAATAGPVGARLIARLTAAVASRARVSGRRRLCCLLLAGAICSKDVGCRAASCGARRRGGLVCGVLLRPATASWIPAWHAGGHSLLLLLMLHRLRLLLRLQGPRLAPSPGQACLRRRMPHRGSQRARRRRALALAGAVDAAGRAAASPLPAQHAVQPLRNRCAPGQRSLPVGSGLSPQAFLFSLGSLNPALRPLAASLRLPTRLPERRGKGALQAGCRHARLLRQVSHLARRRAQRQAQLLAVPQRALMRGSALQDQRMDWSTLWAG